MKLDLVMRKLATFDCGRDAMFTYCVHAASKYVTGAKHNSST